MPADPSPRKPGLELSHDGRLWRAAASEAPEGERAPQADELRRLAYTFLRRASAPEHSGKRQRLLVCADPMNLRLSALRSLGFFGGQNQTDLGRSRAARTIRVTQAE